MSKGIDETVRISRKTVRISQKKKRRCVKVQDSRRTAPQLLFVSKTTWFYTKFQKKLNKLSFLPNNCINDGKVCKSNWAFLGYRSSRFSSARLIACHLSRTVSDDSGLCDWRNLQKGALRNRPKRKHFLLNVPYPVIYRTPHNPKMKEKTSQKTAKHPPWRTSAQGIRIFCHAVAKICHAVAKNCHAFQEKQRPQ